MRIVKREALTAVNRENVNRESVRGKGFFALRLTPSRLTLYAFTFFCLCLLLPVTNALSSSSTFDGLLSKAQATSYAGIETTVWTVGCWTYRTGLGEGNNGTIITKNQQFKVSIFNSTLMRIEATGWSTTTGEWRWDITAANEWHHIAVSYDGGSTANDPSVWIDGVAATGFVEQVTPAGTYTASTAAIVIGNNQGQTNTWAGDLANCFYYNRILSQNEIKQIMRKGSQSISNGLKLRCPLGVFTSVNYVAGGNACTNTSLTANTIGPPVSVPQGGMME